MKKPNKKDTVNLFFSAFLITAFMVCAHFFAQYASSTSQIIGSLISILVYVVFGLLVFYATRVGDGKAVKRFSPLTLIVMVLPALYIIVASLAEGLPFHDVFAASDSGLSVIVTLAGVSLGYGVPYTFVSGFEIAEESDGEEEPELKDSAAKPVPGGVEADFEDEGDDPDNPDADGDGDGDEDSDGEEE